MLNAMLEDADARLELSESSCKLSEESDNVLMQQVRTDLSSFNAEANMAQAEILKAQSMIQQMRTNMPEVEQQMTAGHEQCERDKEGLRKQLTIVASDVDVMSKVSSATECGDGGAGGSFLQSGAGSSGRGRSGSLATRTLVSCAHCRGGRGVVMIRHSKLQPLLNELKSTTARDSLQKQLEASYHEAVARRLPTALVLDQLDWQGAVGRRSSAGGAPNVSEVPQEPEPHDCVPTDKCTVGATSCEKLRDRFLIIGAGIQDKQGQLRQELADLEITCQDQRANMIVQAKQFDTRLQQAQTVLAEATGKNTQASQGSGFKNTEYRKLKEERTRSSEQCCATQNEIKSEKCALKKIRSQLYRLQGREGDFIDCETSEWEQEECTVSCGGGGTRTYTRHLLRQAHGGTKCGPLTKVEPCGERPCPVDCKFAPWQEWSECSADCDGGVKERVRHITAEARYGGASCSETTQTIVCNVQGCNKDCALADWTEWTACSKACDTGSQRRARDVQEEAWGLGKCPKAQDKERLQLTPCNQHDCQELLPSGQSLLRCSSKLDIVVLLDGSGSLGAAGWNASRAFAKKLLERLEGADDKIQVALQLFSGPQSAEGYQKCTSSDPDAQPDMAKDCGIVWVKRLTTQTAEVARMVPNLEWPAGSTYMSAALAEAQGELEFGRQHTRSLVVVVTDGQPISAVRTKEAARRLKHKTRVLWVPVGLSPPMELIAEMASQPHEENIVHVPTFEDLEKASSLNKLIADACTVLS